MELKEMIAELRDARHFVKTTSRSYDLITAAEIILESGWRPMNTAPRDGRDVPVLVKLGGKVEWRQLFASSGGEYWVNHGGGHLYRESECIAWFELPEPPAWDVAKK